MASVGLLGMSINVLNIGMEFGIAAQYTNPLNPMFSDIQRVAEVRH